MKLLHYALMAVAILTFPLSLSASNWFMSLASPGGWTTEDESVSINYSLNKNPVQYGGYLNINCCQPSISAKIKNNTEDFIYVDLAKTYILRNGETELYQNFVTMSTTKDDGDKDATKKSLAQTVMPIPPHATKTFEFPFFESKGGKSGYEPLIVLYDGRWTQSSTVSYANSRYGFKNRNQEYGKPITYTNDNSPVVATISLAYSTTENNDKPIRITKDFYLDNAVKLKDSKQKTLTKMNLNLEEGHNFIIWDF